MRRKIHLLGLSVMLAAGLAAAAHAAQRNVSAARSAPDVELVVLAADGRSVVERLTEGAYVRAGADVRLRVTSARPATAEANVEFGAGTRSAWRESWPVVAVPADSRLVYEESLLVPEAVSARGFRGPVVVTVAASSGSSLETRSWHLNLVDPRPFAAPASGRMSGRDRRNAAIAALLDAVAASATAPSADTATRAAARSGGAEEAPRGSAEVALFRRWSPGVVIVTAPDGLGSGALIDRAQRLIVTNYHVVAGHQTVQISFKPRGTQDAASAQVYRGDVLRYDQVADLAVVRVAEVPDYVPQLELADIGTVEVGADVHAIGHPTGEYWSYTRGIVSQVRRNYDWSSSDELSHRATVIQTQTPINPGNSGGPLLDDAGRIVGINTFGRAQAEGLNFAVSADDVRVLLAATRSRDAPRASDNSGGKGEGPGEGPGGDGGKPSEGGRGPNILNPGGRRNALIYVDSNGDGAADTVFADRDGDGRTDMRGEDANGDGKVEIWYLDENGDGQPDIMGRDNDADGAPDVWRKVNGG